MLTIVATLTTIIIMLVVLICVFTNTDEKWIYAVMITNSDARHKFIPIAIKNFSMQKYDKKHLIILNHGQNKILTDKNRYDNITEILIDRGKMTLGEMRNMALQFVPQDSYWVVYDDDDVRRSDYFNYLSSQIGENDVLFLKNRMELNLNTDFVFRSHFKQGMPLIFSKKIPRLKYLAVNTLEDVNLRRDLNILGKKIKTVDNDPMLYIRIIHRTNTSTYVDNRKKEIIHYHSTSNYLEFNVSKEERRTVFNYYYFFR